MTTAQNRYSINGYVDTNKSVLENMEALASAASSWVTFDQSTGKWSVVINRAGSSTRSFDDEDIIGNISVTETGFGEMYNSVEVQFPHEELLDQTDWVRVDLPSSDRLPNEPNNQLTIQTTVINDPVQAEQIALTELKQSRVSKLIEFASDFSSLGVTAGDIIDITNSSFGWTNKLFRVISVSEEDDVEGNIVLAFTALEYDPDVYDYTNLTRYPRSRATGIKPKSINVEINQAEDRKTGQNLGRLMALAGLSSLLDFNNIIDAITGENNVSIDSGACLQPDVAISGGTGSVCCNKAYTINITAVPKTLAGCAVPANPQYSVSQYEITGVSASDINIPLTGSITAPGSLTLTGNTSAGGKTASIAFKTGSGETRSTHTVTFLVGSNILSLVRN